MIEVDLLQQHPCVRLQISNRPIWRTTDDGTTEHAKVPDWLIKLVHGDKCEVVVEERVTKVVCLVSREADLLPEYEAERLVSPITDEDVKSRARNVVLPENFEQLFREQYGEDPTPEDKKATLLQTARVQLERDRSMLTDLPEEAQQAIRDRRIDVYQITRHATNNVRRFPRWTIDLNDLLELTGESPKHPLWREDGDPERYIHLTCRTDSGKYRWIAIVIMPKKGKKGLVILFPFHMMAQILATKHEWIARVFPTFIDMYPEPKFRPRSRGRRRHYDDGPSEDDEG